MSQVQVEYQRKEKVIYLRQSKGQLRRIDAEVVKKNKFLIRIKAKLDGVRWSFISVREDELERIGVE